MVGKTLLKGQMLLGISVAFNDLIQSVSGDFMFWPVRKQIKKWFSGNFYRRNS